MAISSKSSKGCANEVIKIEQEVIKGSRLEIIEAVENFNKNFNIETKPRTVIKWIPYLKHVLEALF